MAAKDIVHREYGHWRKSKKLRKTHKLNNTAMRKRRPTMRKYCTHVCQCAEGILQQNSQTDNSEEGRGGDMSCKWKPHRYVGKLYANNHSFKCRD